LARVPNLPIETRFERVRALALSAGLGKDPKSGVTAADRHLHCGLLALQDGLIDQGALVASRPGPAARLGAGRPVRRPG
jgi:hypothetical protein